MSDWLVPYSDFHLHSTASDGSETPAELARLVTQAKLQAFSLTDHDSLDGIEEVERALNKLKEAGQKVPRFIPGLELSVDFEGQEVHLLAYFPQGGQEKLQGFLEEERKKRRERNREILEKLAELGYPLTKEDLPEQERDQASWGRLHLARALVEKGCLPDIRTAFEKLLADDRPAYVARERVDIAAAIQRIQAVGGFTSLAHPLQYGWCEKTRQEKVPARLLEKLRTLKQLKLDAVEAGHGDADDWERKTLVAAAAALDLKTTWGSDWHGRFKPERPLWTRETFPTLPKPQRVAAALVRKEGKTLLMRRASDQPRPGFYELPGGKAGPGESLTQALKRELREELVVESEPGKLKTVLWHQVEDFFVIACLETRLKGPFQLRVHDRWGWYSGQEALQLKLLPADDLLFR